MNVETAARSVIEPQDVKEKLARIRTFLRCGIQPLETPLPAVTLFFSVSDGERRARVINASGSSFESAWQKGITSLLATMKTEGIKGDWLRVDWIDVAEATSWKRLRALLGKVKRNYFRFGLALDPDFRFAFTEQELNANAMLYGGNSVSHAVVNENNFRLYAAARFQNLSPPAFKDEETIYLLQTKGVFCDKAGRLHRLDGKGLETGRRTVERLDKGVILSLVQDSSAYLARQVNNDGSFVYGYHACFDRRIHAYNALRHASTTYAMIEAWEVTGSPFLKDAIERALQYLAETLIKSAVLPDGQEAAFVVEADNEIKLGGNAVAILAFVQYMKATGGNQWRRLTDKLAHGIRHMQDCKTGSFVHVLNYPDLAIKQKYRTIYYEGEAAFGLMRLYALTLDPVWLATVEKAFEYFIAQDHWKHHDHWLGYCVNELTRHRPEERYFRFAIRNIAGYLDFVENRITTFPTLLELVMAARQTLSRIAAEPQLNHLLEDIDLAHFERALEKRVQHLLNGHFWPEMAMYCRKPDRIAGSFFIRHHAFRVRIDDVEHYLSGFVAYLTYLGEQASFRELVCQRAVRTKPEVFHQERQWTAAHVEAATGGRWIRRPPADWTPNGLCTYAPAMQPGALVVVRSQRGDAGVPVSTVRGMRTAAGLITTDATLAQAHPAPVLQVDNGMRAVLALGNYARSQMSGTVLGVTGSAGKSTVVSMLAHALSSWGRVGKSHHNANLPTGVAWNLASIPWDTPHVVLELAVGKMGVSARMARPKVAVFTNILPAHLDESSTISDIAKTKSAIFLGMAPGDKAVLNRDMLEWEIVHNAARSRGLDIVTYGTSDGCAFQLTRYDAGSGDACAHIEGGDITYRVGAAGRHMALNGLAVLAAFSALGYPLEAAIAKLRSFSALPGRGEETSLSLDGRRLIVIDDAYNANPGSMRAALERLNDHEGGGRKIAVLGEMAELGPGVSGYHTELATVLKESSIDRVYVIGNLYEDFWRALPASLRGKKVGSSDALKGVLRKELEDMDVVLFKGSNSAGVHEMVDWLKTNADGSFAA